MSTCQTPKRKLYRLLLKTERKIKTKYLSQRLLCIKATAVIFVYSQKNKTYSDEEVKDKKHI